MFQIDLFYLLKYNANNRMRWAWPDKGKRDEYKTADKLGRLCDFLSLVSELSQTHKKQTIQA